MPRRNRKAKQIPAEDNSPAAAASGAAAAAAAARSDGTAAAAAGAATAVAALGTSRDRLAAALTSALSGVLLNDLIGLVVQYAPALLWTSVDASPSIVLSNGGLSASLALPEPGVEVWNSVHSDVALPATTTGIAGWDCRIDAIRDGTNSWGLAVGVVTHAHLPSITASSFCTGNQESFAYLCKSGWSCYNTGAGHPYGSRAVHDGDVVRTEIDHRQRTVRFYVNGNCLGVAYQAGMPCDRFTVHGRAAAAKADADAKAKAKANATAEPSATTAAVSVSNNSNNSNGKDGDDETVRWPEDGRFYACVSMTFNGQRVTIVNVD